MMAAARLIGRTGKHPAYSTLLLAAALALPPVTAFADPPPWAPAWGYRGKHDHEHGHGHKRKHEDEDRDQNEDEHDHYHTYYQEAPQYYDQVNTAILAGTCNRDVIGGAIGGAAGGYVGSKIGKGEGKLAATAAGALIGFIIGQNVGRSMDQVDIRCTGHVLEAAPDRQKVMWKNPDTESEYTVMPTRTYKAGDRYCREYSTRTTVGGHTEEVHGTACRNPEGSWQIVSK